MNGNKLTLPLVLAGMISAHAHLIKINAPVTGATLQAGVKTTISWNVLYSHIHKYDFSFSKDGGTTWTKFAPNATVPDQNNKTATFDWTPADATTHGRIRICQKDTSPTEECTDSTPSQGDGPYMLQSSGDFTVSAASAIAPIAASGRTSLLFDPSTRNVEVTLDLASPRRVIVEAFNAEGRLGAVLFDGEQPAGFRKLSLANGLRPAGALIFRLRAGEETATSAWKGLP